jgi:serralysin
LAFFRRKSSRIVAGNNIIDAGSGNDTIFLANGDRAFGSDGNDKFFGDEASNFRASGGLILRVGV